MILRNFFALYGMNREKRLNFHWTTAVLLLAYLSNLFRKWSQKTVHIHQNCLYTTRVFLPTRRIEKLFDKERRKGVRLKFHRTLETISSFIRVLCTNVRTHGGRISETCMRADICNGFIAVVYVRSYNVGGACNLSKYTSGQFFLHFLIFLIILITETDNRICIEVFEVKIFFYPLFCFGWWF